MRLLRLNPIETEKLIESMENECDEIVFSNQRLAWWMRGGISFVDIMNMSSKEIENLNKIVEENMETSKKAKIPFF
jgi:hypothetical protein